MASDEKEICDNIYQFITKKLDNWMDNEIFIKTSREELGKLYYNHILEEVENSEVQLVNIVIRTMKLGDEECITQNDYYSALCDILHLKKLPYEVWHDVEREYNEIFVHKYGTIRQKYRAQISRIDAELIQTKTDTAIIKNSKPTYSFVRDISTDEQKLYELGIKCNSLRTRKEMLAFVMEYVTSKLTEFCDIQDDQSVQKAKQNEILKLSKEDIYDAKFAFLSYRDYLEIIEDDLDRPYAIFFKVKIYVILENARKKYNYSCYKKSNDEAINEYKDYIQQIPKIDDLQLYKSCDSYKYNESLENLISHYKLIDGLIEKLEYSVCLRERKRVLLKAVELYRQGEYEIFNNILPIQIEGMFADYLKDTTTFLRFSRIDIYSNYVLKDKIRFLQENKSDIYPEAVEYFMYYFNNMIRNKIAHGSYKGDQDNRIQDEIFAKELILDMGMLVHMLSRKSETEKMYRFIHGYQKYYKHMRSSHSEHPFFEALFNDMIGEKIIADYDTIEKYKPIQVAYWLVNPYYEKIYEQVGNKTELLELRNEFLSKDFWEYALGRLNNIMNQEYNHLKIDMEFATVVKGLFRCNIDSDVKQSLQKVNATLLKIKAIQLCD